MVCHLQTSASPRRDPRACSPFEAGRRTGTEAYPGSPGRMAKRIVGVRLNARNGMAFLEEALRCARSTQRATSTYDWRSAEALRLRLRATAGAGHALAPRAWIVWAVRNATASRYP